MNPKWYKYEGKTPVAQDGDRTWDTDVIHARALTRREGMSAEDKLEVWVPTMELRRQLKRHNHTLQQKWLCLRDGSSEWREVPTVDEEGEPYA